MMKHLSKIHPWLALGVAIVSINTSVGVFINAGDLPLYAPLVGAVALVLGLGSFRVALNNKPTS